MNDPKPFASLGPRLLARKGGARPAMRPQVGPMGGSLSAMTAPDVPAPETDLEDLGWNDMGEDQQEARENPVHLLSPATPSQTEAQEPPAEPEVRRQQRAIVETISGEDARTSLAPVAKLGRRAAFTLRLDADRHLKLRLASTIKKRSAQALVTEALDKFLADIPGIDALAAQLQRD